MTCTCEKCNQKRVIDCLFVKADVNLHIARQTQLFVKVNSNTVVCESQLIVVWNDGGKLLGKEFGGRIFFYAVNIYCLVGGT